MPTIGTGKMFMLRTALAALLIWSTGQAQAWDRGTVAYSGDLARLTPALSDTTTHLLKSSADGPKIGIRIANLTGRDIDKALLYVGLTDFAGRGIQDFTLRTDLVSGADTVLYFICNNLACSSGFYDLRALLFDNGRELGKLEFSFGHNADELDYDYSPPSDFDSFWRSTLDSLNAIPPHFNFVYDSARSSKEVEVYRISFNSLHNVLVHGWMTLPAARDSRCAGLAFFPGYSTGRIDPAVEYSADGYATISIQVRGYEVDRRSYPEDNRRYMTIGCEQPESYIYRQIICHCLRAVELLAEHPAVDENRIGVVGGSQGGGLALLVAGLDPMIVAVVANVPFLTDFPRSMTMTGAPFRDLVRYIQDKPEKREAVMNTVRYFDTVSLASRITAPVIISAGLFDRTCPAPSIYRLYLALGSVDKRIMVYPWLDHLEVGKPFMPEAREWLAKRLPPVVN